MRLGFLFAATAQCDCRQSEQCIDIARIGGLYFAIQAFGTCVVSGLKSVPRCAELREQRVFSGAARNRDLCCALRCLPCAAGARRAAVTLR